jgi:hypothetical protein
MMPNWLIRDSALTANEFLVYQALLSRADKSRRAWPSKSLLASDSRLSEATVKRTIPRLVSRGLITTVVRPRGDGTNMSNLYHVTVLPNVAPKPGSRFAYLLRPVRTGEGVTVNPPGGQADPGVGFTMSREEHPVEEHQEEENMRSELPFRPDDMYAKDAPADFATPAQVSYLRDLYIQHHRLIPSSAIEEELTALEPDHASRLISTYLKAIKGRGGMYDGVEEGTPEYDALSPQGQAWADEGMLPPDYWVAFTDPPAARQAS